MICDRETWTPPNLKWREFEKAVLHRAKSLERDGLLTLDRHGVKASMMVDGKVVTHKSYPDFGGTISPTGRCIEIEAKVCAAASFKLTPQGNSLHSHQVAFMLRRADCGAACFLLIHFNLKVLKTKTREECTVAIPVSRRHPLWAAVEAGHVKSISREQAMGIGVRIPWNFHSNRTQTLTPDLGVILDALKFSTGDHYGQAAN